MNEPAKEKKETNFTYFVLVFFIGAISAYDNYLIYKYADGILLLEQNPVGLNIIQYYGVDVFMTIKAVGTIFSAILSFCLIKTRFKKAIWWVFFSQVFLLFYLTLYVETGMFRLDMLRVLE
jgi:hypothetical protein